MVISTSRTRHVHSFLVMSLVTVAAAGELSGQATTPELNFKTAQISEPAVHFTGANVTASGGIGGPGIIMSQPLSVKLIMRDLASCRSGQGGIDVQISNLTAGSLTLPWSPDGAHTVVPQGDGQQIPFDSLGIDVASGEKPEQLAFVELYGAPQIPGSWVTLGPGQSAVLRNISIPLRLAASCDKPLKVTIARSTNRAVKLEGGGYSLMSKEVWNIHSQ